MNIFSKIKYYFKPKTELSKEELYQVFQNHLKIRSELQVSDVRINGQEVSSASAGGEPLRGINFKVNYKGSIVPFWLNSGSASSGEAADIKIQNALTVIAMGLVLKLNLVEISQALKEEKIV